MASRDDILNALRASAPPASARPEFGDDWIRYADSAAKFAQSLKSVGGDCVFVESMSGVVDELGRLPVYANANRVFAACPGIARANVDLESIADPHDLETVDFAILPAEFGVAENGAVWITDRAIKHRAVLFIVQHLALVIPRASIVDNMHQAYQRLSFPDAGFGTFISGPSKTADIEQSLVIGAHGPRSLTVYCVNQS